MIRRKPPFRGSPRPAPCLYCPSLGFLKSQAVSVPREAPPKWGLSVSGGRYLLAVEIKEEPRRSQDPPRGSSAPGLLVPKPPRKQNLIHQPWASLCLGVMTASHQLLSQLPPNPSCPPSTRPADSKALFGCTSKGVFENPGKGPKEGEKKKKKA